MNFLNAWRYILTLLREMNRKLVFLYKLFHSPHFDFTVGPVTQKQKKGE